MTSEEAIRELQRLTTDQEFHIREETWTFADRPNEIRRGCRIEAGARGRVIASANTLERAMDQIRNGYQDQTCAECHYGAIDNQGLCVIDANHRAIA